MNLIDRLVNRINSRKKGTGTEKDAQYEFCPRCDANLTLQKGYRNDLPYWICLGCGEMLINPEVESDSDIAWFCDGCGAMLNTQKGFHETRSEWICTECGFKNRISARDVFLSEDEYQTELKNPYRGLADEDVLALSLYEELKFIENRMDIILVRHRITQELFIKKLLVTYDRSVYEFLMENPIAHMPKIIEIHEGSNCLVVMEEYIDGRTVADILEEHTIDEENAVRIAESICDILHDLHNLPRPIVHRDIKPSNVIVTQESEVYLLDMNVARWYNPDQNDDTRYMGTMYYASPEQMGYGLMSSSDKSDIYALGMMLNVMITGKFPKEERASGRLWEIIERCISLEADKRYSAEELKRELEMSRCSGRQ